MQNTINQVKVIRIFLASSSELKADREQFEIFIYRKCKALIEQGYFLHLDIWEDFVDAMSAEGLQAEYNKAIQGGDIFVLLAHNKVGKYTAQEFEKAFAAFQENKKPFIYTYFKPYTTRDREETQSLWDFDDKLKELKHYKTVYENIEGLREHFGNQLDKLLKQGFGSNPKEEKDGPETPPTPPPAQITTNKADVKGDGNTLIQGGSGNSISIG